MKKIDRKRSYDEEVLETKKTILTILNPILEKSVGLLAKS
jgi:hypothetical protein